MKLPNCLPAAGAKCWGPSLVVVVVVVVTISLVVPLKQAQVSLASQQLEPISANEIHTAAADEPPIARQQVASLAQNWSQFSRDVTNLSLSPDLRSIKLRWTYAHSDANRPESFRIRYCELTSWMAEIKCRLKEMPVQAQADTRRPLKQRHPTPDTVNDDSNSSVITTVARQGRESSKSNQLLPPPPVVVLSAHIFETQIFDLRALTNYTFRVQVARFIGEPAAAQELHSSRAGQLRQRPARRLDLAAELQPANAAEPMRVETTKPFAAEAVKCLADSSEVLVKTGRFFGGRISVEGQPSERCQLVGNKSSEQAVYSFHIDHELCRSKTTDGNRIETMILVHENKDILTHNTARFLVQCNIGQQSFTVKASISLPRVVNSLGGRQPQHSRPAIITPLAVRPPSLAWRSATVNATEDERGSSSSGGGGGGGGGGNLDRVHLGSMPGVYRLTRAGSSTPGAGASSSNYADAAPTTTASGRLEPPPEAGQPVTRTSGATKQWAQTVAPADSLVAQSLLLPASVDGRSQRQSKELASDDSLSKSPPPSPVPRPVDVSSRVLFVEQRRASGEQAAIVPLTQREARLMATSGALEQRSAASGGSSVRKQQSASPASLPDDSRQQRQIAISTSGARPASETGGSKLALRASVKRDDNNDSDNDDDAAAATADDETAAPVIMTNNHRVAGDFVSLAATIATAAPRHLSSGVRGRGQHQEEPAADFSIKYSANKVHEFALDRLSGENLSPAAMAGGPTATPDSGRRRPQTARSRSGRMRHLSTSTTPSEAEDDEKGDARASLESRMGDLLAADASNRSEQTVAEVAGSSNSTAGSGANRTLTGGQPSLAHNITGALLRWSLKTLGNLARKSLESLAADEQPESREQFETKSLPSAVADGPGELPAIWSTGSPAVDGQQAASARQASAAAVAKSAPRWTAADARSHQLDGFIINSPQPRQPDELAQSQAAATKNPRQQQQQQAQQAQRPATLRPAGAQPARITETSVEPVRQARNQQRLESAPTQRSQVPTTKSEPPRPATSAITHSDKGKSKLAEIKPAGEMAESDRYSKESRHSLWPLYGLWALCGLSALIMVALYFVFMSPHRASSLQQTLVACRRPAAAATAKQAKASCDLLSRFNGPYQGPGGPSGQLVDASARPTRNSSEILTAINTPKVLNPNNNSNSKQDGPASCFHGVQTPLASSPLSPSSSPVGSVATRSTSAASSSSSSPSGRENYRKDHEQYAVYADYLVLTDDNSSIADGDDDGKCLTRSGRRRRRQPPGESFA